MKRPVFAAVINKGRKPVILFLSYFVAKLLRTSHFTVRLLWADGSGRQSVNLVTRLQILYSVA